MSFYEKGRAAHHWENCSEVRFQSVGVFSRCFGRGISQEGEAGHPFATRYLV